MRHHDLYGLPQTTSREAAAAYNHGLSEVLRLRSGAAGSIARALALDPTFALAHAALALLGYEMCVPVDVAARLDDAQLHARRATERERRHVQAVVAHVRGDSGPLLALVRDSPREALLLSVAVPTIAFSGVTEVPAEAWDLVEGAAPAYGDDWWFAGMLAFVRQEQGRHDEAMDLARCSLAVEPTAGHSAHARAHAHYETGDHDAGLAWMDDWVSTHGADSDGRTHFSWHAALHELSLGDLQAVRARHRSQLAPHGAPGCRALVDTGSLLWRWTLTPDARDVPSLEEVAAAVGPDVLARPATPFVAMHAAVALLALGDGAGLERLAARSAAHAHPTHREVVAPLARALLALHSDRPSAAADGLARLSAASWRLGGSDAQREILEETRICALLRAGRYDEARDLLDRRLDRRPSPRDARWRLDCRPTPPTQAMGQAAGPAMGQAMGQAPPPASALRPAGSGRPRP